MKAILSFLLMVFSWFIGGYIYHITPDQKWYFLPIMMTLSCMWAFTCCLFLYLLIKFSIKLVDNNSH